MQDTRGGLLLAHANNSPTRSASAAAAATARKPPGRRLVDYRERRTLGQQRQQRVRWGRPLTVCYMG